MLALTTGVVLLPVESQAGLLIKLSLFLPAFVFTAMTLIVLFPGQTDEH